MKIAIASVQSPFVTGGAEYLARGLLDAIKEYGCDADLITAPFNFGPPKNIGNLLVIGKRKIFHVLILIKLT